jgi:hypothetical protein
MYVVATFAREDCRQFDNDAYSGLWWMRLDLCMSNMLPMAAKHLPSISLSIMLKAAYQLKMYVGLGPVF